MIRRRAAIVGLLAGLTPVAAFAQTNIDQGKTPAQIFANDCAACHKAARGLANGKSSFALTEFLREHYTTSRDQAAALAAYVLGAGGGQRPAAAAEETKPQNRPARKPPEAAPATAGLQRPPAEEPKPHDGSIAGEEPGRGGRRVIDKRRDAHPGTAARGHHPEPEGPPSTSEPAAVAHEPAAVAHEPAAVETTPNATETQSPETNPSSAAVSTDSGAGENPPVPRDNIPD